MHTPTPSPSDPTHAARDVRGSVSAEMIALAHQHAYVVTGVDTDTGEVLLMNPWEPTGDPVRLTEAEFQDAMRRVDVSTLEEDS